jgi:uncharacterized protein YbjT (DUF2867 family)
METTMTSPTTPAVLVTGGTGTLGRLVVPRLRAAGCDVRVLSRREGESGDGIEYMIGDLTTGDGLDPAVEGVTTIVHLGGSARGDDQKARNLVRAAARADRPHVVYVAVVGTDRLPVVSRTDRMMFGYFEAKRIAEEVIADSGLPWTTLRATQFHEAMLAMARGLARSPVMPVPSGFRFQPVDGGEVAERLVELALDQPAGLVPDIAGPKVYALPDLLRGYLRATGRHRLMLPLRMPGKAARAYREGANLAPVNPLGKRTWEDFLAEHAG